MRVTLERPWYRLACFLFSYGDARLLVPLNMVPYGKFNGAAATLERPLPADILLILNY